MIMVFIASEPNWKCKNNSTCPFTKTISIRDDDYKFRCNIPREDWEYVDDFTSVVTEVSIEVIQVHLSANNMRYDLLIIIAGLRVSVGSPSRVPFPYRKEKENSELIFPWLSWLAMIRWRPYSS